MRFSLKWNLIFISITWVATSSAASPVQNQNLKVYVEHAINNNPEVQASFHQFTAAMYNIDVAKSGYLPSLDLNGRSEYVDRNYGEDRSYASHTADITLSQMLYDGFQTKYDVQRLKQIQKVRYFELLSTIESIALQTSVAYLDVLQQRELLILSEENLRSHVEVFKQIEEGVIAGVTRRADLEQISGRLSLSESNFLTEQANLHDVAARFLRLTGLQPSLRMQAVDDPTLTDLVRFEDFLLSAYLNNPALKASVFNIDAQKLETLSAKSNFQPKVNVIASYGSKSRDERGLNNTITEGRVGLQFSFNLYKGGADSAKVSVSLENENFAKDLRDKSCQDVRQTVQIAFNSINNLERQSISLNAHRLSSDRVKTAYLDQFNIGQRSLLDLLDSENEFYESSRAYTISSYSLQKTYFTLLNGLGRITESLGLQGNDLSTQAEDMSMTEYDAQYVCPPTPQDRLHQLDDILLRDLDNDDVIDLWDDCPNTVDAKATSVDEFGCAVGNNVDEPLIAELMLQQPERDNKTRPEQTLLVKEIEVLDSSTFKIPFAVNSSKIRKSYKANFTDLFTLIASQPNSWIVIHGHTSQEGSESYNQKLSEMRALATANFMVEQGGIDISRITAVGYGEKRPLVDAENEQANASNRRIEVYLVKTNE